MNMYCLVARNKKDNSFKIIGIKECWYNANGDTEILSYKNTLGSIDLVTSRFKSREDMQKRLIDRGYLDDGEYDIFIASKNKSNAASPMKFQEVIYGPEKNERMVDFREIAAASHIGRLEESQQKIVRVFNKLISKAYYNHGYYYMIMNGYTGIPKRFVNAMDGMIKLDTVPYGLKMKQKWAMESYPAIRNIIESLNRYDLLSKSNSNLVKANVEFLGDNYRQRKNLVPKLLKVLDKDYTVGQISMFDSDNLSDNFAVANPNESDLVEEVKDGVKSDQEEIKPVVKFPVLDEDENVNQITRIMRFLTNLPDDIFVYDENKKLTFNFNLLNHDVDSNTKKKLNSLLTGYLRSYVYMYLFHKRKYNELKGVSYGHSVFILADDMDENKKDIRKNLEKRTDAGLKRVYEWCRICSLCGKMNEVMIDEVNYNGVDEVLKKKI